MTMTMATLTMVKATPAGAQAPDAARGGADAPVRRSTQDARDAVTAPTRARAAVGAASPVPQAPGSDAASAGAPTSPAFADLIAGLGGAATDTHAAPADDARPTPPDDDKDHPLAPTLAASATLPAVQAALVLPALLPVNLARSAAGQGDAAVEGRGRITDPTSSGRPAGVAPDDAASLAGTMADAASAGVARAGGEADVSQSLAHARLRAAFDGAPAGADAGTRGDAAQPGAATPGAPSAVAPAALAASDAAAFGRPAGADVLALRGAEPTQWRPALKAALGERLQVQVGARSEQAVIRLDPPALGRIEIVVRQEGGHLQVHLAASNGDVLRQLHTLTDGLRQDLVHRHHGEVAVTVSDLARDGGQRRGRDGDDGGEATPGRALADADAGTDQGAFAHLQDRE
jgi:flagellar hook-length control protein FliK